MHRDNEHGRVSPRGNIVRGGSCNTFLRQPTQWILSQQRTRILPAVISALDFNPDQDNEFVGMEVAFARTFLGSPFTGQNCFDVMEIRE